MFADLWEMLALIMDRGKRIYRSVKRRKIVGSK